MNFLHPRGNDAEKKDSHIMEEENTTRPCAFSTRPCLSQGMVTHGPALSNDRFCFGEIAPHGHVTIRHGRVMDEGFYDVVMPYYDFLIILVIFLAF